MLVSTYTVMPKYFGDGQRSTEGPGKKHTCAIIFNSFPRSTGGITHPCVENSMPPLLRSKRTKVRLSDPWATGQTRLHHTYSTTEYWPRLRFTEREPPTEQ